MNDISYKFDTSKDARNFLSDGLEKYNFSKNEFLNPIIYIKERKVFGFYAMNNGKIIGGAYGYLDECQWAFLDLLFVEDEYRNKDIGTELIRQVENFAKENNCVGIMTETWDFQAKGFYEKMGFMVYGKLENHPPKAIDYLLKKVLINDFKEFLQKLEK